MKEQDNYRVGEQLTKQELLNLRKGDMFFVLSTINIF